MKDLLICFLSNSTVAGRVLVISGLVILSQPISAESLHDPARIDIFTTAQYPLTGIAENSLSTVIHIYDLDAPKHLHKTLNQGLPADPIAAEWQARQFFAEMHHHELVRKVKDAYAGVLKAMTYGIDRYPAMVFDHGAAVIYGVTDLNEALEAYRQWHRRQP